MWREVEIIAETGTQFGLLRSTEDTLIVVIRRHGNLPWPQGVEDADVMSRNEIAVGFARYCVSCKE